MIQTGGVIKVLPEVMGTYNYVEPFALITALFAGVSFLFLVLVFFFAFVLLIGTYVYSALALQRIAEREKHEYSWFAWVPFLNTYLLLDIAGLNPLFSILLVLPIILTPFSAIPILSFFVLITNATAGIAIVVVSTLAYMNLCEKRGLDRMLGLVSLISIGKLVLLGILAWGKGK